MSLTPYAEGFYAGIRYQRDNILDYISIHLDQGYTVQQPRTSLTEINGQYKRDMNNQVNAMMDGSLDKLIKNLDELAHTVTKIENQAKELIAEVTEKPEMIGWRPNREESRARKLTNGLRQRLCQGLTSRAQKKWLNT
jgi:hypothetical protein